MNALIIKMKHFFKDNNLPTSIPNNESIGHLSRDDRETGSSPTSPNADISIENAASHCFPRGKDLNPARAILAEMLGTFILMFCISGIISSTKQTGGGEALLEYAITAGLTIVVLIFSIGSISGAHVNPAVTIAIAAFGYFPWSKVPLYILAQILGSVLATLMGEFIYGIESDLMLTQPSQGCRSAFMVELISTFIVVFVVAAVTQQSESVGQVSGLVIGIAIGLAVLISGPVSGGSLNPSRSIGPAIVSRNFENIWIYLTAPIIGAVLGALMYKFLHLHDQACGSRSSPESNMLSHSLAFGRS
ncbi:NOD26-LIKE MIP 6, NOD26-like intrinsic protein 7;1, NOD26-LIKE MIP 8 [Hibiscus trionum]|uniref:NOD26-LIKE MIP 6, NOD26-like intrinsic protein 71, NOD26-LIKE MIP 8 n=1 Tax=Hibiscus trionum TaxID=183268 RepID=A0A9W7H7C0_HIBTR|nr:NOD26-LIKE MIP 6, NOD26-like intrinsic protein 7;1, NOD26-LIKE MIP 8 [Hibiscus trionum]